MRNRIVIFLIVLLACTLSSSAQTISNSTPPRTFLSARPACFVDAKNTRRMVNYTSPTESYKSLFYGGYSVVEKALSRETIAFLERTAASLEIEFDAILTQGMTQSLFAPTLPTIGRERTNSVWGALEIRRGNKCEDLPFVFEDGRWKLAIGELQTGAFSFPGGRACVSAEPSPTPKP